MRVHVAGQLADTAAVARVQQAVRGAGHRLTHDGTQGIGLTDGYAARSEEAPDILRTDLTGVMDADPVVVLASGPEPGRGLFVELGAALARAELGPLEHVVVVGQIVHESVFYFHPLSAAVRDRRRMAPIVGELLTLDGVAKVRVHACHDECSLA